MDQATVIFGRIGIVALAAAFCASGGHAGTLLAGSLPVGQVGPSQTVCHWSVYAGRLYVTGSDAFPDICHCGSYCHAYASEPSTRRAMRGNRHLHSDDRFWGSASGFGHGATLGRFSGVKGVRNHGCGVPCSNGIGPRPKLPEGPHASVQAVPLPTTFWTLLAGL
jgi:hypothetical protein